jgi:phosphatidylglycerol:prolipoprotein diacylglycerol transferase
MSLTGNRHYTLVLGIGTGALVLLYLGVMLYFLSYLAAILLPRFTAGRIIPPESLFRSLAYTSLMLLSITTAIVLIRRERAALGLTRAQRLALALGAFLGAFLGAKLPFLLADWNGLLSGAAWFESGKTILFGLAGGYFGVELAKRLTDVRVKTGDSFAVPIATAVAIGRLACFVGGCCYGTHTSVPWAVTFHDGIPRHPTQLYEVAFHGGMAVLLASFARRHLFDRQRIKLYILAYLGYRFATEFIRPEPRVFASLTVYQWGCLALAPVFLVLWRIDAREAPRATKLAVSATTNRHPSPETSTSPGGNAQAKRPDPVTTAERARQGPTTAPR